MAKRKNYFIEGLPISPKWKLIIISILLLVLILNSVLPVFFEQLDYAFNGGVSIILIILIVIFSLGNILTESIVIGVTVIALISNLWDFQVRDLSLLRNRILIGSIIVLFTELVLGKISLTNLVSILKRQSGLK